MNTTFIISGGAGRVVCSIPAFEKYHRLNPDDDFKVLVHGWENIFWSHPLLQSKTFSISQKGVFEQHIIQNKVVNPEPYYVYGYYNQQLSLAEAFDEEINKTQDHSDLKSPKLYISSQEKTNIKTLIEIKKQEHNKTKVVVFQPYGSSMMSNGGRPYDASNRSFDVDQALELIKMLDKKHKDLLIFYMGDRQFKHPGDNITVNIDHIQHVDLRFYISLIHEANIFIGCDSVGQHIARSVNTPGVIVMGSTSEKNVSYPEYFNIYRKNGHNPTYSPIRLSGVDSEFADRMNDGIMDFCNDELDVISNKVISKLNSLEE